MARLTAARRAVVRSPQQITEQLRQLVMSWAEDRPEGVCDALLIELLNVRPDLREKP